MSSSAFNPFSVAACNPQSAIAPSLLRRPPDHRYFTEYSRRFDRRNALYALLEGRAEGRLLAYHRQSGTRVLADGLLLPSDVTVDHGGQNLLIGSGVHVLRFNLQRRAFDTQPFVEALPGTVEKIRLVHQDSNVGEDATHAYSVALGTRRAGAHSMLEEIVKVRSMAAPCVRRLPVCTLIRQSPQRPWLCYTLAAVLPYDALFHVVTQPPHGMLAFVGLDGKLLDVMGDPEGQLSHVTDSASFDGFLYIASWFNDFLARLPLDADAEPRDIHATPTDRDEAATSSETSRVEAAPHFEL